MQDILDYSWKSGSKCSKIKDKRLACYAMRVAGVCAMDAKEKKDRVY